MDFKIIDELKKKLDGLKPLPSEVVGNLYEDLVLRWTYNSNAIEGNTLTLKETKVVLEGIAVGGKTMREHFEVINHCEAIYFVEDLILKNRSVTEQEMKSIHQLLLKNIDDKNAGVYRSVNVTISGAEHSPPDYLVITEYMERFASWYKNEGQSLHPVELASRVHIDFVSIHPFVDGNGRTSRLLMNFELLKAGYPAVVIPVSKRLEYYETLDLAHTTKRYEQFLDLTKECLVESFSRYFKALGA